MKVWSYAEHQEKVKNVNSPEEAAAFAQERVSFAGYLNYCIWLLNT